MLHLTNYEFDIMPDYDATPGDIDDESPGIADVIPYELVCSRCGRELEYVLVMEGCKIDCVPSDDPDMFEVAAHCDRAYVRIEPCEHCHPRKLVD